MIRKPLLLLIEEILITSEISRKTEKGVVRLHIVS